MPRVKLAEQGEPATVVGECAWVTPARSCARPARWQTSPSYGLQFRARTLVAVPPTTLEGIEAYLGSGMIKGIGRARPRSWSARSVIRVFEVIERSRAPARGAGQRAQGVR